MLRAELTPLQRALQLLKRHRDLHFQNDQDDKPVSIIITTLAAKSYNSQANLYDALVGIVRGMPDLSVISLALEFGWPTCILKASFSAAKLDLR